MSFKHTWTSKVRKTMAQYPRTESIGGIGSFTIAVLHSHLCPAAQTFTSNDMTRIRAVPVGEHPLWCSMC